MAKVIISRTYDKITIQDLEERLRNDKGILLWRRGNVDSVFVKYNPDKKIYQWVTLYFDGANDCQDMLYVHSLSQLMDWIIGMIRHGNEFHWFPAYKEAIKFLAVGLDD